MTVKHVPIETNHPRPEPSPQAMAKFRKELESEEVGNKGMIFSSHRAGLKLTSPLFPIMAVVITALTYLFPKELLNNANALMTGSPDCP